MTAIAMERTPKELNRLMGEVQMMRFCNPGITPEQVAEKLGVALPLVRAWGFRDTYREGSGGLAQYRYPTHGEEGAS